MILTNVGRIRRWWAGGLAVVALGILVVPASARTDDRFSLSAHEVGRSSRDVSPTWGIGLMLGDLTGVTAKYWLDRTTAFDFALGAPIGAGLGGHADYMIHLRPFLEAPEAPIYLGGGLFFGAGGESASMGVRGLFGLAYHFEAPFDIFMELAPKLHMLPGVDFSIGLAIGGRIYLGD